MKTPFLDLLRQHAEPGAMSWLDEFLASQSEAFQLRPFYYAFSGATRRFPKTPLPADLSLPAGAPEGFTLAGWSVDQLARTVLLLSLAEQPRETYVETLQTLLDTADMREAAAIYRAFPLLPEPSALVPMAREGLRTNIVSVFDAIALDNPWPAAHLDEEGWNQMVLKAFFLSRPVYHIQGLEQRANPALVEALSNYAHERWAANRPVSPELWRSCQAHLTDTIVADLEKVLTIDQPGNREAVALLVHGQEDPRLASLQEATSDLQTTIDNGTLTWTSLGQTLSQP